MSQGLQDTTLVRTQIYTGGPCTTLRGTEQQCDRNAAVLMALWLVLGWGLSYHKGQHAQQVNWIGYTIPTSAEFVESRNKQGFMTEFTELVNSTLKLNVITKDELRPLAGKANHVWSIR